MALPFRSLTPSVPSDARRAHKGLLREDVLVLRHIFNLESRRQALGETLNLGKWLSGSGSPTKDLLLASIDIENAYASHLVGNGHYQIGVSILDTRDLQSSIQVAGVDDFNLLHTHHFCASSEKYFKQKSWKYCFGKPIHAVLEEIRTEIHSLTLGRDVILIVHGGREDTNFLRAAEININPLYVVDTQKAAQYPLDLEYRCTLGHLLDLLDFPVEPGILHVAGNDANLTLRALLLIVCADSANQPNLLPDQHNLLSALRKIARGPLPLDEYYKEVKARLKLQKNQRKRAKYKRSKKKKKLLDNKVGK